MSKAGTADTVQERVSVEPVAAPMTGDVLVMQKGGNGQAVAKGGGRTGRPCSFTVEMGERICAELPYADGGLEQVCAADGMPDTVTVYRWLRRVELGDFRRQYAQAREEQGEVQAQRAVNDSLNAFDPQLGRLRFDARKWLASKLAARVYGDSAQVKHAGHDGGPLDVAGSRAKLLAKLGITDEDAA